MCVVELLFFFNQPVTVQNNAKPLIGHCVLSATAAPEQGSGQKIE